MSEQLRPWKRPPKSSRFISKYMIERARLTPFQVATIEEMLLEQEERRTLIDISCLEKRIAALKTREGLAEERRQLELDRDRAVNALEDLETGDGIARAIASCEKMMERYELQNVEREKILESLRNQRRDDHV